MEASHSEGLHVPDLTSSDHDHGPRDPERGRKGWSKGGGGEEDSFFKSTNVIISI